MAETSLPNRTPSPIEGIRERHGIHRAGVGISGHTVEDLHKRVNLLEGLMLAGLSLGLPVSFDALGTAAGQHSGQLRGSWVRQSVTSLGTNVTFSHNLGLATPTGILNVGWPFWYWRHDGNNDGAGDTVSIGYINGAIGTDSIQLQLFAAGSRTVDGDHPLIVSVFFIPADG